MYGEPYMSVATVQAAGARTIVLRGFSPIELRRQAEQRCRAAFGDDAWQITDASVVPCLVSLGGRVRLYEGRFSAARS
jgi:hypothetical protein